MDESYGKRPRGRPKKTPDTDRLKKDLDKAKDQVTQDYIRLFGQEPEVSTDKAIEHLKEVAEKNLDAFIRLIHPGRVLGKAHLDLIEWWTRRDAKSHQLCLLPRDHQKSAMVAYRVAWELTKNPTLRVLYISSTANLATKQLKFIKDILTCHNYRFYWPEMVNQDEAKREKWTETEISLDHPSREKEAIRDPSVFTAGLTTNIVGLHCDIAVLDDVVVDDTAYSPEGREKVRNQVSYLASIASAEGRQWVVGTRYHPKDLYCDMMLQFVEIYDKDGSVISSEPLYEIYEKQVEDRGDGTGDYLWPREQREDGKWFGFNQNILARKKAQYTDPSKFRAQYYNDPNDEESAPIKKDWFQYYDTKFLKQDQGRWYFKDRRLNVFAAIDFAFSLSKRADYTAIVVVGVDSQNNIYILDIDRFKTSTISEYFNHILRLFVTWNFRKLRAEITTGQKAIVESLKQDHIRPNGLALSVEDTLPTKKKEERMEAVLQPKYSNLQVWHPLNHIHLPALEEELVMKHPPHDDVKDCLASVIEISLPPSFMGLGHTISSSSKDKPKFYNSRFGGIG